MRQSDALRRSAIVIDTAATKNATKRTRMSLFMVVLVHRSLTNPM